MRTALIGYGAHGKDIQQIWMDRAQAVHRWASESLWCFDEHTPSAARPPIEPHLFYLGPYDPQTRWDMWDRYVGRAWASAPALVHPSVGMTYINQDRKLLVGLGVVVARNVVLDHHVTLGMHTHVNYSASMTRCNVGNFCTISPGVTICGDVTIGDRVFIGAGAVITNLVNIGYGAVIGAGAVVLEDVRPCSVMVGNPARAVKTATWTTGKD